MSIFNRFAKDESGATAIEYGLIAALVSVAIIAVLGTLGDNLKSTFQWFPTSWAASPTRSRASAAPAAADAASDRGWRVMDCIERAEPWADHRFPSGEALVRPGAAPAPGTDGGTSIEYAFLVGLIALVIIGALGDLGSALIALPLPALIAAFEGAVVGRGWPMARAFDLPRCRSLPVLRR